MIQEITIKNFKSIANDTISLGRVNVFIGENGCGKSNILEAVGFLSACAYSKSYEDIKQGFSSFSDKNAIEDKGIRMASPALMSSVFTGNKAAAIDLLSVLDANTYKVKAYAETTLPHWDWAIKLKDSIIETWQKDIDTVFPNPNNTSELSFGINLNGLKNFLIYSLNTRALRGYTNESRKNPLGVYGEKLDRLIAGFSNDEIKQLKEYNYLISWLDDFFVDIKDEYKSKGFKQHDNTSQLYFKDKFMKKKDDFNIFSSENANEGVLHVLFYLALLISEKTPKFFAIDNIESCLNPHLCRHLMKEICKLAKKTDKQMLITTHNPAILDGLNLNDDEVRLFEVFRNDAGHTQTRRIKLKDDSHEQKEGRRLKLSELWTRGYLGAISNNFE